MIECILIGLAKFGDNILNTFRTISIYKNKKILTFFLTVICQYLNYTLIKSVVSAESELATVVVCIAAAIGTTVALYINGWFAKDATYTNILTCSTEEPIDDLCHCLLEHNIKYVQFDSASRTGTKNKTILAFATTKKESEIIDDFLKTTDGKFMRQVLR